MLPKPLPSDSVALRLTLLACLVPSFFGCASRTPPSRGLGVPERETSLNPPLVIAHRGASGHRPEHTLESYDLAISMGADFIEPDLVPTKDGVLIARHENLIDGTTDVAVKFPSRKATKTIEGKSVTGFFTEDFTLAEIKTLRARERLEFRNHAYDGKFAVPTFDEVLALAKKRGAERGRPVGVYPETKHPSYFRSVGVPLEEALVAALEREGLNRADAPVFIQSFEVGNLKALRLKTSVRLVQLIGGEGRPPDLMASGDARTYADLATPAGLDEIRTYAAGIGPFKNLIVPVGPTGELGTPTSLVKDAHVRGLVVHPWTFRNEERYLAPAFGNDPAKELALFLSLGVDGVFADFPDAAVAARDAFALSGKNPR